MQPLERLSSWKEIASYLGCDERTAQRWEGECGLPVHRTPGRKRGSVFAFRQELDGWLKQDQKRFSSSEVGGSEIPEQAGQLTQNEGMRGQSGKVSNSRNLVGFTAGGALLLIGAVVTLAFLRAKPAIPARMSFTANVVQALDDRGRVLWSHQFTKPIASEYVEHSERLTTLVRFIDARGDGSREIIMSVPLQAGPNPSDRFVTEIDCFSSDGRILWSYVPQEIFRFGNYELNGPWWTTDIFASLPSSRPKIWAAFAHYEWGNSFVVQLDPETGHATLRFVNTGIIYKLNEIQISGRSYLLAGGFNNEYAAGSLGIIDEVRPFAVSPQTAGTRHYCLSCPAGAPDYYFIFPKSEINIERNAWEDSVKSIEVSGQDFEVSKMELGNGGAEDNGSVRCIYVFHSKPSILPFSFRFDSSYDLLHRQLEKEGKLHHSLEMCPERLHPKPVRLWTPSNEWTQVELNPIRSVD